MGPDTVSPTSLAFETIPCPPKHANATVPRDLSVSCFSDASQTDGCRRCLLLKLIGFSALERAVRRTPRCRPFFGLAGRPTLINFNRRQPSSVFRFLYRGWLTPYRESIYYHPCENGTQ